VSNPIAQDFLVRGTPAQFLFATEDGTISTWSTINGNFPTNAPLAVDDCASGAVYKGLAIVTPQCCREYLALANFPEPSWKSPTLDQSCRSLSGQSLFNFRFSHIVTALASSQIWRLPASSLPKHHTNVTTTS
jgi:hypothetical protein